MSGLAGRGACDPEVIRKAIERAGAVVPAFPVWVPGIPAHLAISEADRHRLVKAAKSPTKADGAELAAKRAFFDHQNYLIGLHDGKRARTERTGEWFPVGDTSKEVEHQREAVAHGTAGAWCVIERRKWANEYRVRTQVETTSGIEPPDNSGPRISSDLSDRALRALTDSAAYVAAVRAGYTTFVTLTFGDDQRAKLKGENPETSIQREVSRCMDAWQKMHSRGMKREGIPGNTDPLDYLWVVEVPKNESGEDNPHVHILMRWAVPFEQFKPWAARLEKAWGHGFAHIEKIKKGESAGAYIAKAAGYLCKAQGASDQGEVRGNRYGISESARAPGWETLTKTQLDCMSQLIADIYDHLTVKHGPDYQQRAKLNRQRQGLLDRGREARKLTGQRTAPDWITRQKKKIENRLQKVRDKLNALPVRCNRYQLVLKGDDAFQEFMAWSQNPDYPQQLAEWLPVKPEGVMFRPGQYPKAKQRRYFVELRAAFQESKRRRQAVTDDVCGWMVEQVNDFRNAALSAWQQWQWVEKS